MTVGKSYIYIYSYIGEINSNFKMVELFFTQNGQGLVGSCNPGEKRILKPHGRNYEPEG